MVKLELALSSGRLDLTDCRLTEIPPEVFEMTDLQVISSAWSIMLMHGV